MKPPVATMEARVREALPTGRWAYEPKWDGFRSLCWAGPHRRIDSRNQRPLLRYFPELAPALDALPQGAVVDGEIVVVIDGKTDFDALQNRLHPAESRVRRLADETPAELVAFDLLGHDGKDVRALPFTERREQLVALDLPAPWHLTPSTTDVETARRWFTEFESAGCDGVVCKLLDGPYVSGDRAMVKVKHRRDADCVVGGFRVHKDGGKIGSLLLGLYDDAGELAFVGHCSGFGDADRVALLERLEPLVVADSFGETARRPGEPSRWSADKDLAWTAVVPELVCQVSYDQITGERFRHATRFERWRPDKAPRECTFAQLERPSPDPARPAFGDVVKSA